MTHPNAMPVEQDITPDITFEKDIFDEEFELSADADEAIDIQDDMLEDGLDEELEPIEFDSSCIDVESIIALTARLAHVLAREADLLAEMKVSEMEGLQKEKLQLLEALEAHKKFVDRNPQLLDDLSDDECLELAQIIEVFQTVMRENHRRLLIAREVNRKVVQAISDTVKEAARGSSYDGQGHRGSSHDGMSMSLNQTI